MSTYTGNRPNYKQVFSEAMQLSLRDQRKLREELAKLEGVTLIQPAKTPSAIRSARKLADQIRKKLQATSGQSLDDTMRRLRGRSWS
jgi:hypothetical protein